jgi:hypothetical protein
MESGARFPHRSLVEWILIYAFAAALLAPSIDPVLRPKAERTALAEFRSPAEKPVHPASIAEWQAYPAGFEAWFNDHFGLRDKLVRWHNMLDWYGFGVSPTPKLVLGKGAWIYYADDKSLDVFRGAYPLSPNELEGWRGTLTARRDWLAARNIRYLFAIVPNKDQIYPEHLPSAFDERGATRSDQLIEYLRAGSDIDVLDLRPALLAEKQNDRDDDHVYHRLGTHWTDRGAYAGYAALIERLKASFPNLVPVPRDSFTITSEGTGDTWAPHLYMEDLLTQANYPWHIRSSDRAKFEPSAVSGDAFESFNSDTSLPRAAILHDSFGPVLRPWLAENFSHAWWSWGWSFETHLKEIATDHPDIVIEMFVDRALVQNYPQVSLVQGPGRRRDAFTRSTETLLRLDESNRFDGLLPFGRAELGLVAGASPTELSLKCATPTDGLLIPPLRFPATEDVIVATAIDSPVTVMLDLFFQKRSEPTFERRHTCSEKIYKGSNVVYFRLFAGDLAGSMHLRPRESGEYRIRSIEARAVSH